MKTENGPKGNAARKLDFVGELDVNANLIERLSKTNTFYSFCLAALFDSLTPLLSTSQKRKTTTISVEVKKSQHKYIIGPKGNTLQEILETTGVSVEMPQLDSGSETIILRGEPDKLGPALTQVYAKVRLAWIKTSSNVTCVDLLWRDVFAL